MSECSKLIYCPKCTRQLEVPESFIGKKGECPYCGEKFIMSKPTSIRPNERTPKAIIITEIIVYVTVLLVVISFLFESFKILNISVCCAYGLIALCANVMRRNRSKVARGWLTAAYMFFLVGTLLVANRLGLVALILPLFIILPPLILPWIPSSRRWFDKI